MIVPNDLRSAPAFQGAGFPFLSETPNSSCSRIIKIEGPQRNHAAELTGKAGYREMAADLAYIAHAELYKQ
jgi:hypothetical protein